MLEFDIDDLSLSDEEEAHAMAALRANDPVHWDEKRGRWLVTRHEDVKQVSRRPDLFSSEPMGPWHAFTSRFSMQAEDGPAHHRTRGVVSRGFTPRTTARLESQVRRYADAAIDAIAERGRCDLVQDIAVPVPMRVIADMLGIAREFDLFRRWVDTVTEHAGSGRPLSGEARAVANDFETYVRGVVAERLAAPEEDLISTLLSERDSGVFESFAREPFPGVPEGDGIIGFISFLVLAGSETTRHAISQGTRALLEHPDQLARLRSDPSPEKLRTATDEILRWVSPVRALQRTVMHETSLRGRQLEPGQCVILLYASANRDEAVFEDGDHFLVARDPNDHLSFGFGTHYCLGANLARMEIRVTLERILARLPDLRLATDADPVRFPSAIVNGLEHLEVEYTGGH